MHAARPAADAAGVADIVTIAAARPAASTTPDHLPIGLFGAVMGLTGLALARRLAR